MLIARPRVRVLSLAFLFITLIRSVIVPSIPSRMLKLSISEYTFFFFFFPLQREKTLFLRINFFFKRAQFSFFILTVTKRRRENGTRGHDCSKLTLVVCTPASNLNATNPRTGSFTTNQNTVYSSTTSSLAFLLRSPSISHYFILERISS